VQSLGVLISHDERVWAITGDDPIMAQLAELAGALLHSHTWVVLRHCGRAGKHAGYLNLRINDWHMLATL
jgi:hypothetical protein